MKISILEKGEFFIPVTDSAKQYNEKLIHDMKQKLTTTDQSLDSAGYMTATSVINYTKDYYNSHPRIKMTSFSVDNNKGVDSYLVGLGQPSATVYQLGYYGPGGHPEVMDPKKNFTFVRRGNAIFLWYRIQIYGIYLYKDRYVLRQRR